MFFQSTLSEFEFFWNTVSIYLRCYKREVGKNTLNAIFVFLSKSFHLHKPCLCSYKIGIMILSILGGYGPCEVLVVTLDPLGTVSGYGSGSRNVRLWLCPLHKSQRFLELRWKVSMLDGLLLCQAREETRHNLKENPGDERLEKPNEPRHENPIWDWEQREDKEVEAEDPTKVKANWSNDRMGANVGPGWSSKMLRWQGMLDKGYHGCTIYGKSLCKE